MKEAIRSELFWLTLQLARSMMVISGKMSDGQIILTPKKDRDGNTFIYDDRIVPELSPGKTDDEKMILALEKVNNTLDWAENQIGKQ